MDFPKTTQVNKRIPKQKFYENLAVSPQVKRLFVEDVKGIYWANKIAPTTLSVTQGPQVGEIEVFRVLLARADIDEAVLRQIDKGIPYHILFVLEHEENFRFCIAYKEVSDSGACSKSERYYYSPWMDQESAALSLNGLTMDEIYEDLIRQIAGAALVAETGSVKEDIALSQHQAALLREIEKLTKKARAEKQPKKKFELSQQVNRLKKELSE